MIGYQLVSLSFTIKSSTHHGPFHKHHDGDGGLSAQGEKFSRRDIAANTCICYTVSDLRFIVSERTNECIHTHRQIFLLADLKSQ